MMRAQRSRFAACLAACLAAMWALACGPAARTGGPAGADADFACKGRRVAYIVTGSFAGHEVGVVVDCEEHGPRIHKWIQETEGGERTTMAHSLAGAEFDELWARIESTGWRHLRDCENPEAVEGDPEYKIGIKDQSLAVSLTCSGKSLPFPYNRLINELDLKVAEYGSE